MREITYWIKKVHNRNTCIYRSLNYLIIFIIVSTFAVLYEMRQIRKVLEKKQVVIIHHKYDDYSKYKEVG